MGRIKTKLFANLLTLVALSGALFAYQGSNELVYIPSAKMMRMGYIEMGTSMFLDFQNNVGSMTQQSYFRTALSENFEYAVKFQSYVSQSLHGRIYSSISDDNKIGHFIAFGFKDVGWQSPQVNVSYPVYTSFISYTFSLLNADMNIHVGVGQDYSNNNAITPFFGADQAMPYGTVLAEWDGKSFNVGYKYTIADKFNLFLTVTPMPMQHVGGLTRFFSFGFSIHENLFEQMANDWTKTRLDIEKNIMKVNTKLDVIEARNKAAMDVVSVKFLEDLEKAFIEKKLAKKTFEEETKSVIKLAVSHMQKGLEAYYQKKFDEALNEYRIVTSIMPNLPIGFIRMGSIYLQQGDRKEAIRNWEHAIKLDPNNEQLKAYLDNLIRQEKTGMFAPAAEQETQPETDQNSEQTDEGEFIPELMDQSNTNQNSLIPDGGLR